MTPVSRPRLRGGLRVARRDADHVQVGVDPPHRAVLPDRPEVRRLLHALVAGRPVDERSPAAREVLRTLADSDLLVDEGALDDAARRRGRLAVALEGPQGLVGEVRRALDRVGVPDGGVPSHPRPGPEPSSEVVVAVSHGEPARERSDALVRDDVPHLLVSVGPVLRVGPFVVPGLTACLRCLDAHLGERDPRRSLVVEQVTGQAGSSAPLDGDPASRQVAWAVVARDLVSYGEGLRPATWSASLVVDPSLRLTRTGWRRHPRCGCSWDVARAG